MAPEVTVSPSITRQKEYPTDLLGLTTALTDKLMGDDTYTASVNP